MYNSQLVHCNVIYWGRECRIIFTVCNLYRTCVSTALISYRYWGMMDVQRGESTKGDVSFLVTFSIFETILSWSG
jgi:hypothetical protein